jgi:hypothetical protein
MGNTTLEATRILSTFTNENNLTDVTNILSLLVNQTYTANIFANNGIVIGKSVNSSDKNALMINSEIDQVNFFVTNPSEQLRGYDISQGTGTDFISWDNSTNINIELQIKPTIENQQNFFKVYLSQQFRSYNISYQKFPQYYDNITDEYIIMTFSLVNPNITPEQQSRIIEIYENIISKKLKISKSKITTTFDK